MYSPCRKVTRLIYSLQISGLLAILIISIVRDFPIIGTDYRYFIPRMVDTYLYYRLNGLSIQWYTPTFGGGLPAYPNPQHIQFSLPQLINLWFDPVTANVAAVVLFTLLGFVCLYLFLHQKVGLSQPVSWFGALVFAGNGFYFQHAAVGHLGYQPYHLLSLALLLLCSPQLPIRLSASILGLLVALCIHQAGFYLLIIWVLSLAIALPLLNLLNPNAVNTRTVISTGLAGAILGGFISASKVFASLNLLQQFPRLFYYDQYDVPFLHGIGGLVIQLLGSMHFLPISVLLGRGSEGIRGMLVTATGAQYGLWELDVALSPSLVYVLLLGLILSTTKFKRESFARVKANWLPLALLVAATWITVEFCLAKGLLYPVIRNLPVLRSLHVNVRFTSAFILPLVITGAWCLEKLRQRWPEPNFTRNVHLLNTLSVVATLAYLGMAVSYRPFDARQALSIYDRAQSGETFPIQNIQMIGDSDSFAAYASSLDTYEPIFGYDLEVFHPQLQPGPVYQLQDGYFNLTNPVSLVYPQTFDLVLFERIQASDLENLEKFINHYRPSWDLPLSQQVMNFISLAALSIVLMFITSGLIQLRKSPHRGS